MDRIQAKVSGTFQLGKLGSSIQQGIYNGWLNELMNRHLVSLSEGTLEIIQASLEFWVR